MKLVCEMNRIQYMILSKKPMKKRKITTLTERNPWDWDTYLDNLSLVDDSKAPDSNDVTLLEKWAHLDLFSTNFPKNNKVQNRVFISFADMYFNYTTFVGDEEEKIPLAEHQFSACIKSILNKHNKNGNLVYASDDGIRICIGFGNEPNVVLHARYN